MPWQNQGGGGWKGGGPWGQGPSNPQGPQPNLEELLRRSQDRLKQSWKGSGPPAPLILLIGAVIAAIVGFYAFTFTINADEKGLVLRFGKFVREENPGLHLKLPYPIEEVMRIKPENQNVVEIGFGTSTRDAEKESHMLTGDGNIVDLEFVVFWKIKEPRDFLFNVRRRSTLNVKDVAESAMREVVGKNDIQPVLTGKRDEIEKQVQTLMQQVLDSYKAGVQIERVRMQRVDPPKEVIAAFRDVQVARANEVQAINEADKYKNQVTLEATGEAAKIKQIAEGYRLKVVNEAKGQSARFLQVFEEYKKAPDVTRRRIYLEAMERVMQGSDKIILDNKNSGVVPFLPLNEMTKR